MVLLLIGHELLFLRSAQYGGGESKAVNREFAVALSINWADQRHREDEAERIMVELKDRPGEDVSAPSLKYINRLSDYLFVAGRYANDKGARDVLWAPGQNR